MDADLRRIVRVTALGACALAVAMLSIYLATGIGQEPLQAVHAPAEYAALLLRNPPVLRVVIALDNLFALLYASLFVVLGILLRRADRPSGLVEVAVGLLLTVAVLDYAENLHFLVMLADSEAGRPPSAVAIRAQVLESLLKFHVSYVGLFLLGLALPRRTASERALANLLVFVQAPVGILIYVTPSAIAIPLVLARLALFVAGFLLIRRMSAEPAAGGLPDAYAFGDD